MFCCAHCVSTFNQKGNLQTHLYSIHFVNPLKRHKLFKCDFCESYYALKENLRKHIQENHKDISEHSVITISTEVPGSYMCIECGKTYTNKISYNRHLKTHKDVTRKCSECDKTYKNKHSYNRHIKTHKGANHKCSECSKTYNNNISYNRHIKTHNEATHECPICSKKFHLNNFLQLHLRTTHLGIKNFKCVKCTASFTHKVLLKNHVERIHPTDPEVQDQLNKCQFCDSYYRNKIHLSTHILKYHRNASEKYIWNEEKVVSINNNKNKSKNHQKDDLLAMALVEADVDFVPDLLDIRKVEIVIKDGNKFFKCEVCNQFFVRFAILERHVMSRHSSAKPYKCSLCDVRFKLTSSLRDHMKKVHFIKCKVNCNRTLLKEICNLSSDLFTNLNKETKIASNIDNTKEKRKHNNTNLKKNVSTLKKCDLDAKEKTLCLSMPLLANESVSPTTLLVTKETENMDVPMPSSLNQHNSSNVVNLSIEPTSSPRYACEIINPYTKNATTILNKDAVLGQANVPLIDQVNFALSSYKTSTNDIINDYVNDAPLIGDVEEDDAINHCELSLGCELNDVTLLTIAELNEGMNLEHNEVMEKKNYELSSTENNHMLRIHLEQDSSSTFEDLNIARSHQFGSTLVTSDSAVTVKQSCFEDLRNSCNSDQLELTKSCLVPSLRKIPFSADIKNRDQDSCMSSLDVSFDINNLSIPSNNNDISLSDLLLTNEQNCDKISIECNNLEKNRNLVSVHFDTTSPEKQLFKKGIELPDPTYKLLHINEQMNIGENTNEKQNQDSSGISPRMHSLFCKTNEIAHKCLQNYNINVSMLDTSLSDIDIQVIEPLNTTECSSYKQYGNPQLCINGPLDASTTQTPKNRVYLLTEIDNKDSTFEMGQQNDLLRPNFSNYTKNDLKSAQTGGLDNSRKASNEYFFDGLNDDNNEMVFSPFIYLNDNSISQSTSIANISLPDTDCLDNLKQAETATIINISENLDTSTDHPVSPLKLNAKTNFPIDNTSSYLWCIDDGVKNNKTNNILNNVSQPDINLPNVNRLQYHLKQESFESKTKCFGNLNACPVKIISNIAVNAHNVAILDSIKDEKKSNNGKHVAEQAKEVNTAEKNSKMINAGESDLLNNASCIISYDSIITKENAIDSLFNTEHLDENVNSFFCHKMPAGQDSESHVLECSNNNASGSDCLHSNSNKSLYTSNISQKVSALSSGAIDVENFFGTDNSQLQSSSISNLIQEPEIGKHVIKHTHVFPLSPTDAASNFRCAGVASRTEATPVQRVANKVFKAPEKVIKMPSDQELHPNIHAHGSKLICDRCGKGFCTKATLTQHLKYHNPISFLCWICGEMFRDVSLRRHPCFFRYKMQCVFCGEKFKSKSDRLRHVRMSKEGFPGCKNQLKKHKPKIYKCTACKLNFHHPSKLWSHQATVHNEKRRFVCNCGKAHWTQAQLSRHQRTHNFKCCDASHVTHNRITEHVHLVLGA